MKGSRPDTLRALRLREKPTLAFLSVLIFVNLLLGRGFLVENPGGSDMYSDPESPIRALIVHCGFHTETTKAAQCAFGAESNGRALKKETDFHSDCPRPPLRRDCPGDHEHLQIRNHKGSGELAAQSAVYTRDLAERSSRADKPSAEARGVTRPGSSQTL